MLRHLTLFIPTSTSRFRDFPSLFLTTKQVLMPYFLAKLLQLHPNFVPQEPIYPSPQKNFEAINLIKHSFIKKFICKY